MLMGRGSANRHQRQWRIGVLLCVLTALSATRSWGLAQISIGNGPTAPDGSYLNVLTLANNLVFTGVIVQADSNIDFVETADFSTSSFGTPHRFISFVAPTINLFSNVNMSTGAGGVVLTANTLNLGNQITSGGDVIASSRVISSATQLNVLNNNASIQQAMDVSSGTASVTVNVSPGMYVEAVTTSVQPGLMSLTLDAASLEGGFAVTGLVGISMMNGSTLSVTGGAASGDVTLSGGANMLNWRGGQIGGTLSVDAGSMVRLFGSGFEVDTGSGFVAVPFGSLSAVSGQLRGVLASAEPFQAAFARSGVIELVWPAYPCGDGVLDAGEQCDDSSNDDGDCCSATCQYEADGGPCPGGSCDGAGACIPSSTTTTSTSSSTTSTTASSTSTTTTAPMTSSTTTTLPIVPCAVATKPKLTATKLLPPPGDDKLLVKGEAVVPVSPPLDPPDRGVRILLTGATEATLLDVTIEPGAYDAVTKSGWKTNGAHTAWTYTGPGTATAGIQNVSVKLNAKVPGGIKFSVKGKNGTYAIAPSDVPVTATLVLDVPAAATGQCVEVNFPAPPPASPSCTLVGATLKCK